MGNINGKSYFDCPVQASLALGGLLNCYFFSDSSVPFLVSELYINEPSVPIVSHCVIVIECCLTFRFQIQNSANINSALSDLLFMPSRISYCIFQLWKFCKVYPI